MVWPGSDGIQGRLATIMLALAVFVLAGCAESGGDASAPPGSPADSPPATARAEVAQLERAIVDRINQIRRERGLEPLEPRDDVAAVARGYSQTMLEEDFFSHVSPDGETVADRIRQAGVSFIAVGENLAKSVGPVDHVAVAVDGWMESEGHRANIVRETFTQTGVGVAIEGETFYATQVFLRP